MEMSDKKPTHGEYILVPRDNELFGNLTPEIRAKRHSLSPLNLRDMRKSTDRMSNLRKSGNLSATMRKSANFSATNENNTTRSSILDLTFNMEERLANTKFV